MQYIVSQKKINGLRNCILLVQDNWDDYFFKTTFYGYYFDKNKNCTVLGEIKIGYADYGKTLCTFDYIPKKFNNLPSSFFSLWQSAKSYSLIRKLQDKLFENIFSDLNDFAYDLEIMNSFEKRLVSIKSLFRTISKFTCRNQFNRISHGQIELTKYSFNYCLPNNTNYVPNLNLSFNVIPDSYPPTNIHVIIGRNGVGKTRLFNLMISDIYNLNHEKFTYNDNIIEDKVHFEGIMHISFSPFDSTIIEKKEDDFYLNYNYLGVNKINLPAEYSSKNILEILEEQMIKNFELCISNKTKFDDWLDVIDKLSSDLVFSSLNFNDISYFDAVSRKEKIIKNIKEKYILLSSGHKAVLTIVTSIVAKLAEQTIVFIDEPENHLHPPLLSTMMRVISSLLRKRNAVAIIATHSPIVLQEVPKSCVWLLNRDGDYITARRPSMETFGANVGSLINEVFGYEVQESGFHKVLTEIVNTYNSYEEVIDLFNGQLGDDAKSLLRLLFLEKGL